MTDIDQIKNMTPEELGALEKKLAKKLVIRIAVRASIGVAIAVGASLLAKKFENSDDED